MTSTLIPVAQYLRMSTEHQQYSLKNQSAAIQKYADDYDEIFDGKLRRKGRGGRR